MGLWNKLAGDTSRSMKVIAR